MPRLRDILSPRLQLLAQQRRIEALEAEIAALRAKNAHMRAGMRRCISCTYRVDARRQGDGASAADVNDSNPQ